MERSDAKKKPDNYLDKAYPTGYNMEEVTVRETEIFNWRIFNEADKDNCLGCCKLLTI